MENNKTVLPDIELEDISVIENEGRRNNEKKFDSKNYLNVSLDKSKGETSKNLKIRLLPIIGEDGVGRPFHKIHIHTIKVPKEVSPNEWKSYACLEKNEEIDKSVYGSECPICKLNREAKEKLASGDALSKEEKGQWEAIRKATEPREAYIARCIERGHEEDGPKFWRIKGRYDHTDPFHAIMKLADFRKKEGEEAGVKQNILSVLAENGGKDLNITINEGTAAPTISDASIPTSLTKDPELYKKWCFDEKKWFDVFPIKPKEYMELVYMGQVPWRDKKTGKWISKEEFEKNKQKENDKFKETIEKSESVYTKQEIPVKQNDVMSQVEVNDNEDEEDLPF